MDKTQLILFSAVILILAIRIYQKYVLKSKRKTNDGSSEPGNRESYASNKSDDYEPYSKK